MYVYFDANGTLKEIISDKSFRVGDSKKDKIYVYWDGEHTPVSGWVKYRKPNGREYPDSVEQCFFQFGDNLVGKALPNKPLRNLKYFSYDHTYEENGEQKVGYLFYEITIPDEILNSSMDNEEIPNENNMVVARIRFVMDDNKNGKVDEADSIETLGTLVFSVETNIGILTDSSINETQYNYLIQLVSMKLGTNTKSVKVSQLPSTGVAGTIYYVKNTESDLIYDAYFWNGSNFVYLGTTSYGLYTEQEGDYFETAIQTLWTAEMNDYEALINGEFETYKSSLNSQMIAWGNLIQSAASGSPKGAYPTLSALQSAFPTGTNGIYVVSENGHWYYWSGTAWIDGGVYQAREIADKSITPNKTNFCKYVNVLNPSEFIIGKDMNGQLGKIDALIDNANTAISAIIDVSGYSKISYNFQQGGGTIYEFDVSGNLLKNSGWLDGGTNGVITLQGNTTQIRMTSGKDYITTKCIQLGEVADNSFIEFGYVSIQTIENKITNEKIGNEILKVKNELNDPIKSKCKMIESYQQIIPMDNLKSVANGDPTCDVFDDTNTYFSNKSKRITCTKVDGASKYLTWINLSNYNVTNWDSITIVVYVPYASYDYQGLNGARLVGYVNGNPGRGLINFTGRVKWGWNFIKFRKLNKAPSPYNDLTYDLGQLTGINFVIEPRDTVPVGNKCSFIIDSIIIDLKMKPCVLLNFDFVSNETLANNGFNLLFSKNLKATMFSQNFGNFLTEHKNMYDKMVNEYDWELGCYGGANGNNSIIRSETNKVSDKTKDLASLLDEYYSVYSINPVSYACSQAVLDPKIEKAVLNNNFKMIRAVPNFVMTYFDKNCSLISHIDYTYMTYEDIKNLIDDTIKYGDCLPLFTHSIRDDDSDPALEKIPYSIMEQVCNYLKTKVDTGEIEVLTYSEFYNRCVN